MVFKDEMPEAAASVSDAKNQFLASPDTKFARTQVLRVGAKAAFFACQSKEAVQRAINNKPRVDNKAFQAGDLVCLERSGTRKREET